MSLKAVLFDLNGVIINDAIIHKQLIDDILLKENLRSSSCQEYQKICLGKTDRIGLREILAKRGRIVSDEYLEKLIKQKGDNYYQILNKIEKLPIFEKVIEFILQLQNRHLSMAVVTGALYRETDYILQKINVRQYFNVLVTGDDTEPTLVSRNGYLLAVEKLNQQNSDLCLSPKECIVIEDTSSGIEIAKKAGFPVVGVANTYPFHIIQRQANWCVDHLLQLDLDWVDRTLTPISDIVE